MVSLISYNVNGIRAALKKGFAEWLVEENPDIICLQEIKASPDQIDTNVFSELGYEHYWFPAEKKGYSGVAVFTKIKPDNVVYGMDNEIYDFEGRLIRLDFGDITLINTYMPSGTSGDIRQTFKYKWLDDFFDYINELKKERENIVICGDFNICHKEIDIHNPVSNKNSSGFLPEERAWVTKFIESGFTDSYRHFNKDPHKYSWWSYRAGARKNNKGWRIDYFMTTTSLDNKLIESDILMDVIHSDHCPIKIKMSFE
ncbi:MAG: exodeoxyribonuclease III [Thalassobius sp.]|nr:exodeoxyribonuclease III [Thalassovita sp.]